MESIAMRAEFDVAAQSNMNFKGCTHIKSCFDPGILKFFCFEFR